MKKQPSKKGKAMTALAKAKLDLAESDALRDRMSEILRGTANALHNGPLENGYWSWHDLPELADGLQSKLTAQLLEISSLKNTNQQLLTYIKTNPDPVVAKRGTAYADHVEFCAQAGMMPMTPAEFAKEDKRLVVDWNRRRHGVDPGHTYPKLGHQAAQYDDGDGTFGPCIRILKKPSLWARFNRWLKQPVWGKY
jgi:hypothetical protein